MTNESPRMTFKKKLLDFLHYRFLRYLPFPWNHDQLIQLLRDAEGRHLLDTQSLYMIENVLQASEIRVGDIMVPRSQMIMIDATRSFEEILPIVVESGHSRFPVMEESSDEIIGILLAKDLLGYTLKPSQFDIHEILRTPVFIPDSKRLNLMLQDFRRSRNHMAIVVDEYGHPAGLLTIEDVLEQIVGEIEDEHDVDDEMLIRKHSETQFIVKGLTPIEDFNHYFGCKLDEEAFDTIGGLVTHGLGHLPRRGETLSIEQFRFRVLHADSRRVRLLRVILNK